MNLLTRRRETKDFYSFFPFFLFSFFPSFLLFFFSSFPRIDRSCSICPSLLTPPSEETTRMKLKALSFLDPFILVPFSASASVCFSSAVAPWSLFSLPLCTRFHRTLLPYSSCGFDFDFGLDAERLRPMHYESEGMKTTPGPFRSQILYENQNRMTDPKMEYALVLITPVQDNINFIVSEALTAGVCVVQIRDTVAPKSKIREAALDLMESVFSLYPEAKLIINKYEDVALEVGAHGLHLPENYPKTAAEIRKEFGADFLIGRSVHSLSSAQQAMAEGVSYIQVGTMFETASHPGKEPEGPALLERIRGSCGEATIVAIGGINESNAAMMREKGADGIAVISAITRSKNPRSSARTLLEAFLGCQF